MQLSEINMSPTILQSQSNNLNVLIGIEYEFIAKGYNIDDDLLVPDFDTNTKLYSIAQAISFFSRNNINDPDDIKDLEYQLRQEYNDERKSAFVNDWGSNYNQYILLYFMEKLYKKEIDEQIIDILEKDGYNDETILKIMSAGNDKAIILSSNSNNIDIYMSKYIDTWSKINKKYISLTSNVDSETTKDAYHYIFDNHNEYNEQKFFELNYPYALDLSKIFNLNWPDWSKDTELQNFVDHIGYDIGDKLSRNITSLINDSNKSLYTITTDNSIDANNNESGVELISPPLPLKETIQDFSIIKNWINDNGHYTNSSTGLHINVSFLGKDIKKIDYVKLVLLLGDNYILSMFDRLANEYTRSSFDQLNLKASSTHKSKIHNALVFLKQNLNAKAASIISKNVFNKYDSINIRPNYVEFRAMGGNWSKMSNNHIMNYIFRMIVVLDAAMSPNKFQKEYQIKLYKLLSNHLPKSNHDLIPIFVNHISGNITKEELKTSLKGKFNAKLSLKQFDKTNVLYYMFANVTEGYAWYSVTSDNKDQLINKAFDEYKKYLEQDNFNDYHSRDPREIQDLWQIEKSYCKIYPIDEYTHNTILHDGGVFNGFIYDMNRKLYRGI